MCAKNFITQVNKLLRNGNVYIKIIKLYLNTVVIKNLLN